MKKSTTTIATTVGGSYIGKLCRHFAHKIETTYTADTGKAIFPFGVCDMSADEQNLVFDIVAQDEESVEKIKGVIVRHLVKFAYKEDLQISWKDEA